MFNQEIYGVQLKDKDKKFESQSGGAFTAFAEEILSMQGVVYGVGLDENLQARYCRVTDIGGLSVLKGSKYIQALIDHSFLNVKKDLLDGKKVLFSGTPCCVDGLLSFLDDCNTNNLITIDLICHGVASPLIYNEYLNYISENQKKRITKFNFRDKQMGWHTQYETYFVNGRKKVDNIFAKLFSSRVCLRESCYNCKYTNFSRHSDITVGDFWGIEKIKHEIDDNTGISLVLINTEKGKKLFEFSKDQLICFSSKKDECKQPQLCYPSKKSERYDDFWVDYRSLPFKKIIFNYGKGGVKGVAKSSIKQLTKTIGIYEFLRCLWKQIKGVR